MSKDFYVKAKAKRFKVFVKDLRQTWIEKKVIIEKNYANYRDKVRFLTELNDLSKINGIEKRGSAYHLDHIIPIKYGFDNNLSEYIIASISNLQIITRDQNFKKGSKYFLLTQ